MNHPGIQCYGRRHAEAKRIGFDISTYEEPPLPFQPPALGDVEQCKVWHTDHAKKAAEKAARDEAKAARKAASQAAAASGEAPRGEKRERVGTSPTRPNPVLE